VSSADHFNIELDLPAIDALLDGIEADRPRRLRLLVAPNGIAELQVLDLPDSGIIPWVVPLDLQPVPSEHEFLYHKTTVREVYDSARSHFPDAREVLLWNEHGELTETTTGNLVVELDGQLVTPPISCGLLPGTLRAELLDSGTIVERSIHRDDLSRATATWMINSMRGWVPIEVDLSGVSGELDLDRLA
jgi:para-aminobenzoate synthetase/4-amino-4-deoxychorismate lyase